MKKIFCALLIFLFCQFPAQADSQQIDPFLAVYCNPGFEKCWANEDPDYIQTAGNWNDFKLFITQVKRLSGKRPVIIDIDCHGSDDGYLAIVQEVNRGSEDLPVVYLATEGYVLNQIDRLGKNKVVCVCQEACFAGVVYKRSIRNTPEVHIAGSIWENHEGVPTYPVYGVDNVSNWNNSVYVQYMYGDRVDFHDLRTYETESPGEPDTSLSNPKCLALKYFAICWILSQVLVQQQQAQ